MSKAEQFATWYSKMDYEGGLEPLIYYGFVDSGDSKLNSLMEELKELLERIHIRVGELEDLYPESTEEPWD